MARGVSRTRKWQSHVVRLRIDRAKRKIWDVEDTERKAVDLVAVNDQEKIAIEIETGKSGAFYNLTKDLGAGFWKVIVVEVERKQRLR